MEQENRLKQKIIVLTTMPWGRDREVCLIYIVFKKDYNVVPSLGCSQSYQKTSIKIEVHGSTHYITSDCFEPVRRKQIQQQPLGMISKISRKKLKGSQINIIWRRCFQKSVNRRGSTLFSQGTNPDPLSSWQKLSWLKFQGDLKMKENSLEFGGIIRQSSKPLTQGSSLKNIHKYQRKG